MILEVRLSLLLVAVATAFIFFTEPAWPLLIADQRGFSFFLFHRAGSSGAPRFFYFSLLFTTPAPLGQRAAVLSFSCSPRRLLWDSAPLCSVSLVHHAGSSGTTRRCARRCAFFLFFTAPANFRESANFFLCLFPLSRLGGLMG